MCTPKWNVSFSVGCQTSSRNTSYMCFRIIIYAFEGFGKLVAQSGKRMLLISQSHSGNVHRPHERIGKALSRGPEIRFRFYWSCKSRSSCPENHARVFQYALRSKCLSRELEPKFQPFAPRNFLVHSSTSRDAISSWLSPH